MIHHLWLCSHCPGHSYPRTKQHIEYHYQITIISLSPNSVNGQVQAQLQSRKKFLCFLKLPYCEEGSSKAKVMGLDLQCIFSKWFLKHVSHACNFLKPCPAGLSSALFTIYPATRLDPTHKISSLNQQCGMLY